MLRGRRRATTTPRPAAADARRPAARWSRRPARPGTRVTARRPVAGRRRCRTRLGRTAYRVVQEALTNARKHAPGQPVDVARWRGRRRAAVRRSATRTRSRRPAGGRQRCRAAGTGAGRPDRAGRGWPGGRLRRPTASPAAAGCRGRLTGRLPRPASIRVLIVDDDALVRAGLTMMLDGAAGHRGRRRGRRRRRGDRGGRRAPPGRRADGHPDAAASTGSAATAALRAPARPARGDRADHLRRRRERAAGAAGRRQRLPAQGHPAGPDRRGDPAGRGRRPDPVPGGHPPADRPGRRRPAAGRPSGRGPASPGSPSGSARWSWPSPGAAPTPRSRPSST